MTRHQQTLELSGLRKPSLQQDHQGAAEKMAAFGIMQRMNQSDRHIDVLVLWAVIGLIFTLVLMGWIAPLYITPVQQEVSR